MKITHCLLYFIGILLLNSCQLTSDSKEEKEDDLTFKPSFEKTDKAIPEGAVDLLDLSSKKGRKGIRIFYDKNEELYTGKAIQHSRGDSKTYLEYTIEEGKMTRLRGFYENGNVERDFPFKEGLSHGTLVMYYENGEKYVEEEFTEGKMSGKAMRWHENGKIWREATFKDGKLKKETLYAADGSVK